MGDVLCENVGVERILYCTKGDVRTCAVCKCAKYVHMHVRVCVHLHMHV